MSSLGFELLTLFTNKKTTHIPCLEQQRHLYYLLEDKGQDTGHLVLKPFIGNCSSANTRYRHGFCILKVQKRYIVPIKSIVQEVPRL